MINIKTMLQSLLKLPISAKMAMSFALFLAVSIGFAALADEVHEGETLGLDRAILEGIHSFATPFWDSFFLTVTHLGDVILVAGMTAALIIVLSIKKKYKYALLVAAGVGGAALVNLILKFMFERARPDLWQQLVVETSFSFPSGHAMASAALACCVIAVFWRTKFRIPVILLTSLYTLVVGFSRLYLGVHYPTDVFGGWLLSTAWVLTVVGILYGWGAYRRTRTSNI